MASTKTSLLDLPVELFHAVLVECIRVRIPKRALRLRLVNRLFASEVIRVIHEYHILEDNILRVRQLGSVGAEYLSRRLLRTKLPIAPQWANIRCIATRLAQEDDEAVREERYAAYVQLLCGELARRCDFSMSSICMRAELADRYDERNCGKYFREHDLLTAAAYTNKIAVIEEVINDPDYPGIRVGYEGSFGNPFDMAASRGHHAVLDLLYRTQGEFAGDNNLLAAVVFRRLSLDIEIAKRFLPTRWTKKYLEGNEGLNMLNLERALRTPSVEIFQMVMQVKESTAYPTFTEQGLNNLLGFAARHGWLEMVQYLLSIGAPVDVLSLRGVFLKGHMDIAQLLLDHGAEFTAKEMGYAAEKGRWEMVRWLAAQGVDLNVADPSPLISALLFERADVARELVALGATADAEFGRMAKIKAENDGLDSMVVLAEELSLEFQEGIVEFFRAALSLDGTKSAEAALSLDETKSAESPPSALA
ncbi:ankyrin repeat-containing domain protein [Massariosphaeria phaeospora]|uniref:Ankyrin repeat-containing domain protein n=1 Tax=Massariosphaeria phaeospora TaxID=100035 RepID=A0A7C8ME89_9PLEO|nr:ankyrin repeat-containing domain protein [Massariosphaeria phaeospora]